MIELKKMRNAHGKPSFSATVSLYESVSTLFFVFFYTIEFSKIKGI